MKQFRMRTLCISIIFMIAWLVLSASTHASEEATPQKVTFVYNTSPNPPIILGEGTAIDEERPGTTIELLRLVDRNIEEVEIAFKRVPWKRGLILLEANEVDGTFHASFKEERLKIGVYPMKDDKPDESKQVLNMSYMLYKLKDSPLQWDGEQFSNLDGAIGATIGFVIIDDLKEKGVTVDESKKTINGLLKVQAGRLAAFAELETMADAVVASDPERFQDIVKVQPPLRSKPYYLMLSHGFVDTHPELAQRIWDEIENVRESKEFQQIFAEYAQ